MKYDCIIVGGGLAGGLLLYALKESDPKRNVLLVESGETLGGKHTWCFHEHDVDLNINRWLYDLIYKSFDGYEVIFPEYKRVFTTKYHAITSDYFHKVISNKYQDSFRLGVNAEFSKKDQIVLSSGEIISSDLIVDTTGWGENSNIVGYQKFVGLNVILKKEHNLKLARLKDATVDQIDGYRFMYLLPWNDKELLVEDTYYSLNATIDKKVIEERIFSYLTSFGYEIEEITYKESGALPLVCEDNKAKGNNLNLGVSSGAFHPVTGYSLPYTLRRIQKIIDDQSFKAGSWNQILAKTEEEEKANRRFFHILNKMVFKAADDEKRVIIFQRFYRLNESLIQNFYKGELSSLQMLRILVGKPPVPVIKAIKSIFNF